MIARSAIPLPWVAWNAFSGAPFHGPFAHFRVNSQTRIWEYPWAAEALGDLSGKRILDVGGSLGGLAFVLGRHAAEVVVVDPDPSARSAAVISRAWARECGDSRVTYVRGTAAAAPGVFDAAVCLSVIEHIFDPAERRDLMQGVWDRLLPGGRFVVSVDLNLHLFPFTSTPSIPGMLNVSVAELLACAPFTLVGGIPNELYGLPGFSTEAAMTMVRSGEALVGQNELLSQCFVLARSE